MTNSSASTSRASSSLARSLSITASTPTRVRSPSGCVHRGDPAAPRTDHDDVLVQEPSDRPDLEDALGFGRGHHPAPFVAVLLEDPSLLGGQTVGLGLVVDGTHELGRVAERRIGRVDLDHRQDRRERHLQRQQVAELLLQDVADHPLGLRAQDIERVRLDLLVRRALQGEQPDLRAVAVGQHELVIPGHCRQRRRRGAHVGSLRLRRHRLAALQQGVTAQRDHDPHVSRPGWPPSRP